MAKLGALFTPHSLPTRRATSTSPGPTKIRCRRIGLHEDHHGGHSQTCRRREPCRLCHHRARPSHDLPTADADAASGAATRQPQAPAMRAPHHSSTLPSPHPPPTLTACEACHPPQPRPPGFGTVGHWRCAAGHGLQPPPMQPSGRLRCPQRQWQRQHHHLPPSRSRQSRSRQPRKCRRRPWA